jgi:hemolysin III
MSATTAPTTSETFVKPLLRGVSHEVAFFVVLVLGPLLGLAASGARATMTTVVYATSLAAMFGCSALLHRGTWSEVVLPWMRRLDHSMIFVFVAGTYTPVLVLSSLGALGRWLLVAVWVAALGGVAITLLWLHAPRWVTASCYLVVGWAAVIALPALWIHVGVARVVLLTGGGILFTVGAVVYARQRPDPVPKVFGYHEVFHALVILAVVCHYVLIASLAI